MIGSNFSITCEFLPLPPEPPPRLRGSSLLPLPPVGDEFFDDGARAYEGDFCDSPSWKIFGERPGLAFDWIVSRSWSSSLPSSSSFPGMTSFGPIARDAMRNGFFFGSDCWDEDEEGDGSETPPFTPKYPLLNDAPVGGELPDDADGNADERSSAISGSLRFAGGPEVDPETSEPEVSEPND